MESRLPTVQEYQRLRETTSWGQLEEKTVSTLLSHTLYAVCITREQEIVASGRIIGDGAYFYIQDVIVLPHFKNKDLGRTVMEALESWLTNTAQPHAFVGLMAAKGTAGFYEKLNYKLRDPESPGMFKILESD